jgi:hypothetical protein
MSTSKNTIFPWRRMMIESVAIILSILLAFAIDAGWDEYKESTREKAFLVSLLSDFKETNSRIDESTAVHLKYINSGRQLLSFYSNDASIIDSEALEKMLCDIFFDFTTLYLPSGTRDALFASGDIQIISNFKLRSMLAAWPTIVADALEDDSLIAYDVMNNMAPYLRSKVRTRNVMRFSGSNIAAEYISPIEAVNYDVLWSDPTFDNLVTFRIINESYSLFENDNLKKAANEIIQLIEKELQK